MRLIDAEALKEKFKEHYDLFVSGYKNEQDMSLADKSRVDEILNSMAEVINAPTVCDIEQIRAEIKAEMDDIASGCVAKYSHEEGYYSGLKWVLKIIDKYTAERR